MPFTESNVKKAAQRDALLPKLLFGELRVSGAMLNTKIPI